MRSPWWRLPAICVLAAIPAAATIADDGPQVIIQRVIEIAEQDDAAEPSKYWLGVACETDDDEPGVVLARVMPDTPAAAAGLQAGDVLLQLGDKKVNTVAELVDAVTALKGKKTQVRYQRDGENAKVQITPAERPQQPLILPPDFPEATRRQALELIERFGGQQPRRFLYLQPGMMLPTTAMMSTLPAGVKVTVEGQDDKPAKVTITKGDQVWETTTDKLHELPEEARKLITPQGAVIGGWPGARIPEFRAVQPPRNEVEELRKQIEELRLKMEVLEERNK